MNELKRFSAQLRFHLKDNPKSRPFVCDGNPLDCQVFIVGFNAATEMKSEFWNYWNDESGFDKEKWIRMYEQEREISRKTRISPTRERINRISNGDEAFLETNIYFIPTSKEKDLKSKDQVSVFQFLLEEIKPKVVLLHGKTAVKYFNKMIDEPLSLNVEKKVNIFGFNTDIFTRPHLSRVSYPEAEALGKDLDRMRKSIK